MLVLTEFCSLHIKLTSSLNCTFIVIVSFANHCQPFNQQYQRTEDAMQSAVQMKSSHAQIISIKAASQQREALPPYQFAVMGGFLIVPAAAVIGSERQQRQCTSSVVMYEQTEKASLLCRVPGSEAHALSGCISQQHGASSSCRLSRCSAAGIGFPFPLLLGCCATAVTCQYLLLLWVKAANAPQFSFLLQPFGLSHMLIGKHFLKLDL